MINYHIYLTKLTNNFHLILIIIGLESQLSINLFLLILKKLKNLI